MKKSQLFIIISLLLISLLPTIAFAAKQEQIYSVTFTGDIEGTIELSCRDRGKRLDLYGKTVLDHTGDGWITDIGDWGGLKQGSIRIWVIKDTGEVAEVENLIYNFDKQPFGDYFYPKYNLEGSDGSYDIHLITIERTGKSKKSAISLQNNYLDTLELDFEVKLTKP
jgi:hypothetical protein